jgi:hypothetical protein
MARADVRPERYTDQVKPQEADPPLYSDLARNQKFESTPLQRRVHCEPGRCRVGRLRDIGVYRCLISGIVATCAASAAP